jgi:hypothetical protein
VDLKVFPQCSNSPIVSSVLLPLLSGLPAIFQVFFGVLTSFPHEGHLAIMIPFQAFTWDEHKTFSIERPQNRPDHAPSSRITSKNDMRKRNHEQKMVNRLSLKKSRMGTRKGSKSNMSLGSSSLSPLFFLVLVDV